MKDKKLLKALIPTVTALSAAAAVMKFCKSLGASPDSDDGMEYKKRAANFYNGKFHNINNITTMTRYKDPDSDRKGSKGTVPESGFFYREPSFSYRFLSEDAAVTWFGHSSVLLQMNYQNILIDPVFSKRTSPFQFAGPARYNKIPVNTDELPDIDICVISHDHYDHLDYNTIRKIDSKVYEYIVPLGVEKHLIRFGVNPEKITNMAWWEEHEVNGLKIVCTPSQHFSGRKLIDNNKTLWASWIFMDENHRIFESGDTGFSQHFEEIHRRYGDMDLVMLDCSQYNERWHNVHMFPEEAVKAAEILGAGCVMPVHWGAFVLSDHSWDDPANRLVISAEEKNINWAVPEIGETLYLSRADEYKNKWWKTIN